MWSVELISVWRIPRLLPSYAPEVSSSQGLLHIPECESERKKKSIEYESRFPGSCLPTACDWSVYLSLKAGKLGADESSHLQRHSTKQGNFSSAENTCLPSRLLVIVIGHGLAMGSNPAIVYKLHSFQSLLLTLYLYLVESPWRDKQWVLQSILRTRFLSCSRQRHGKWLKCQEGSWKKKEFI